MFCHIFLPLSDNDKTIPSNPLIGFTSSNSSRRLLSSSVKSFGYFLILNRALNINTYLLLGLINTFSNGIETYSFKPSIPSSTILLSQGLIGTITVSENGNSFLLPFLPSLCLNSLTSSGKP